MNFLLPMSPISLVVDKALVIIYDFQASFQSGNATSILLKVKKTISRITLILVLVNKNVSWKKKLLLSLLVT